MPERIKRSFLAALLLVSLAGCKTEVYSNLPEREANEIIASLGKSGISGQRERAKDGSYSVSIEADSIGRATEILDRQGLPRQRFESLGGVFQSNHMVATPFEERARFMHALNQELANSLTQISGVESARVHVMLPEASPLESNKDHPRASVFIYHDEKVDLHGQIPVIKTLIVNSISGLAYEDVAVALFPTAKSHVESAEGFGATFIKHSAPWIVVLVAGLGFLSFSRLRRPLPART
jgi:type III secretion protein J